MFEHLTTDIHVCVSKEHTFGTDALYLSRFIKDICPDAKNICDLGTGCGIIPLCLAALHIGKDIVGIDIQSDAIDQFDNGIAASKTDCHIKSIEGDFTDPRILSSDTYDLVVSNPPYFKLGNGILSPHQHRAISRYEIKCNVDSLFATCRRVTSSSGCVCVCYPPNRLSHVLRAMEDSGFSPRYLRFISKGSSHNPWLFFLMGQKDAGDQLVVLPTIYNNEENTSEVFFK